MRVVGPEGVEGGEAGWVDLVGAAFVEGGGMAIWGGMVVAGGEEWAGMPG